MFLMEKGMFLLNRGRV